MSIDFTVIDTETTGLSPDYGDRIVEIAIVHVSSDGKILDEFVTLINPERSVGPTYIHHITKSDVQQAPRFADVAGEVLMRLKNTVIVGHNVTFDKRFLLAECSQAKVPLPEMPYICTRHVSSLLCEDLPSRRLHACCEHLGISLSEAHSALGDARATAQILCKALRTCALKEILTLSRPNLYELSWNVVTEWPTRRVERPGWTREQARTKGVSEKHWSEDSADVWWATNADVS